MKWPSSLILIRHAKSEYNALKEAKDKDTFYRQFLQAYDEDPGSERCQKLARQMQEKYRLKMSDADTKLTEDCNQKAVKTGRALSGLIKTPEFVYLSPYKRTRDTYAKLCEGWPGLKEVPRLEDERLREQDHGLALLFNDWKIFFSLYPEQRALYQQEGPYWYRWPQGENVPDVRLRNNLWITTLIREFAEKQVLVVTHHLNILATRANLERWSTDTFIQTDKKEKPANLGVTKYWGEPKEGKDGKIGLVTYNQTFWDV